MPFCNIKETVFEKYSSQFTLTLEVASERELELLLIALKHQKENGERKLGCDKYESEKLFYAVKEAMDWMKKRREDGKQAEKEAKEAKNKLYESEKNVLDIF